MRGPIETYVKHTGGAMNPFSAWTHLKSLDTLDLRVRAQAAAAMQVAGWLEAHPKVNYVRYPQLPSHPQHAVAMRQSPSGGTVIAFDVKGGKEACFTFLNALELFTISNNFADAKSIVTHPATTTHSQLTEEQQAAGGIKPELVRLSVGIEHIDDILEDLDQALASS